jgi:hypothetical protein
MMVGTICQDGGLNGGGSVKMCNILGQKAIAKRTKKFVRIVQISSCNEIASEGE